MNRPKSKIRFLRTTAIGGLLFLLPLIVVGALIGQVVPIIYSIATTLADFLPGFLKTGLGVTLLLGLSTLVLLMICFGAGVIARWSLGKRLSTLFEKNLLLLFPRYAILKDQMADSIGGDHAKAKMKPVLVTFQQTRRIAFETERSEDSTWVAVYFPGAPDAWAGYFAFVDTSCVRPLEAEFGEAVAACEQLGRGCAAWMGGGEAS